MCLRVGNNKNDNPLFQEEPEIKPCADNMQVCTSLFRYDPQTVLQEGQYCACAGCSNPVWDEEDGMSLTWYHHERGIFSTWNCTRDIHSRASMEGGGAGAGGGEHTLVHAKTGQEKDYCFPLTDDNRRSSSTKAFPSLLRVFKDQQFLPKSVNMLLFGK